MSATKSQLKKEKWNDFIVQFSTKRIIAGELILLYLIISYNLFRDSQQNP